MGSVGQERKEFVCDCRWKIFGSLVLQDRYDLRFLEFKGICLELEWKITTMSLIFFRWFELTASVGVEIWYHLATTLCRWVSARFCLLWFSPTMVSMMRSYSCFACNRRFGNICSSRWSKWENFITNGLVTPMVCLQQAIWKLDHWANEKIFITIDLVTSTFRNAFIEIQAGTIHAQELELCVWLEWRATTLVIAIFEKKVWWLASSLMASLWELCNEGCGVLVLWRFVTFAGRTRDTNLEVSAVWGCQMRLVFFACPRSFNLTFFFWNKSKTNNQFVQISFRCVWAVGNFSAEEAATVFFCPGMSKDIQTEMCVHPHIFHLKEAQRGQAWFKQESKQQDRKQAQTLLFPSVRWSKSWNLRDGLCVWVEKFF